MNQAKKNIQIKVQNLWIVINWGVAVQGFVSALPTLGIRSGILPTFIDLLKFVTGLFCCTSLCLSVCLSVSHSLSLYIGTHAHVNAHIRHKHMCIFAHPCTHACMYMCYKAAGNQN